MSDYTHVMNADELRAFMRDVFPSAGDFARLEKLEDGCAWVALNHPENHLRPGNTVSGPAMMTLVDTAAYFLILSLIGKVALAVTTSLHIDFLRRPDPKQMVACARMLKLGSRLAVCAVEVKSGDTLVAHATATYSIPPKR